MAEGGFTQHTLALAAGVGQTYIRDILMGRSREPRRSKLEKIAEALNCSLPELFEEEDVPAALVLPGCAIDVRGAVQAGAWRESMEWAPEERFRVPLPAEESWKDRPRYGLLVEGDSMNKVFPPGSIAIVINFADLGRHPQNGDYVVVERRDPLGDGFEATIKALQLRPGGQALLWPKSTAPEFQSPLELPRVALPNAETAPLDAHDPAGAPDVTILALVVGLYAPQPRAYF